MAAGRIIIPGWFPALDQNGVPIPNAKAYFYLDGTTTLTTVYADEALTTPLTNPVEANSSGQFPSIWADSANTFSVTMEAPFGPPGQPFTFDGIVPSEPSDTALSNKADTDGDNLNTTDKESFIGNLQVSKGGFWTDQAPGAVVWRAQDRFLFGDAVQYTGGRFGTGAGLGTDWLTTRGANYFSKNAQVMGLSTNRIGALFGSWTPTGTGSLINMGLGGVTLNEGTGSTGRAIYAEALHYATTGVTVGLEVQGGNFTAVMPTPSAYGLGTSYHGMQIGVQSGVGYVLGNDNTPIPVPTMPSGTAIDISGGEQNLAVQRWTVGITIRNGGLFRGVDGLTGTAKAISMAQRHEVVWEASASLRGAAIRSDVTAVSGQDVSLVFSNNRHSLNGTGEASIAEFASVASSTNFFTFTNSATGGTPTLSFTGSDAAVSGLMTTKGAGVFVFRSQANASEVLRLTGPATAVATNYVNMIARAAGSSPSLQAAGTDTNAGVDITGKGTSGGRLISGGGSSQFSWNNTGWGFGGTAPTARVALPAAATDLASAITLLNAIRADLIAHGHNT